MKNFLLHGKTAKRLYARVKDLPIYDFHCHLPVDDIISNKPFMNLTELWLSGDHYKWRQMRTYGVDESKITGDATPYEKFLAYAEMLGYAVGNPLSHWSQAELLKYFGIKKPLNASTAHEIWCETEEMMKGGAYTPAYLINMSNVHAVCIIEDAYVDVRKYVTLKNMGIVKANVLPAFRGDKAMNVFSPDYNSYVEKIEAVTGIPAPDYSGLKKAVKAQITNFAEAGATGADFAFEGLVSLPASEDELDRIYKKARSGEAVTEAESDAFVYATLLYMVKECYKSGMAVQLHAGAMRDNNLTAYQKLGPDTGYDSISTKPYITALRDLLKNAESEGVLGKTMIFNLNPCDNDALLTLVGCFQGGGVKGRVQLGAAWWFNDTKDGMENHLKAYSRLSTLACFVGMLTDSRSFVSYPRHDYFRRILCNYLGNLYDKGEFNQPIKNLEKIAEDISFYNSKTYFVK